MRTSGWIVVAVAAWLSAGCAFDEHGGDDDVVAVAKKSLPVCKTKKNDKPKKKEKDCYTTTTVGAAGGVVEHPNGVTLTVPAGAVDHDVAISVRDEGAPGPAGTQMFSPVFTFEPDGTQFARPVQVQFDVPATVTASTVYWSRATSTGVIWDRIPATVAGGVATSQITHFSGGGAGEPSDAFDLHIIKSVTWDRLDTQHIEFTDFGAAGAATAYPPVGMPIASETWHDAAGQLVLGEGMIRNIPDGEMWIQIGTTWVWTSLAQTPVIDLSSEQFGTFGRATPNANLTHPVDITVTGNTALTADDALELLVPDANAFYFAFPDGVAPVVPGQPAPPTAMQFTWDLNSPFSVDNFITSSDVAYFAQLTLSHTAAPDNLPYIQMTKIGVMDPAGNVPQAGGSLSFALQDLPATQAQDFTISASEYQSMFAAGPGDPAPLGTPADQQTAGVRVLNFGGLDVASASFDLEGEARTQGTGSANVGVIGATADFAFVNIPASSMTASLHTGALHYGVPAGTWDTFAGLAGQALFAVQLACPGTGTCSTAFGWARQIPGTGMSAGYTDFRLLDAATFEPTIGPPRDVRIDGADASAIGAGVSHQPMISWSTTDTVPATGRPLLAPQMYRVQVFHHYLDDSNGTWRTQTELLARFFTTHTSMTLPAGVLVGGEYYSIVVKTDRREPTAGVTVFQEPGRFRYPNTEWSVASAPFQVAP